MSEIILYGGPMFSGKTSKLLDFVSWRERRGDKVLCVKPSLDIRYDTVQIVSHDGAQHSGIPLADIRELTPLLRTGQFDALAIDEVSLFDAEGLSRVLPQLVVLPLCMSGFDFWHDGRVNLAWGAAATVATKIEKLTARCRCGAAATMTFRSVPAGQDVVIGGSDIYQPRCFSCWSRGKP